MIIKLIHSPIDQIKIENMTMQLQIGESDCGIFAIAIATCLCNGDDPTIIRWDQRRMRQHLICCFESEKMVPYPTSDADPGAQGQARKIILCIVNVDDVKWVERR